MEQGSSFSQDKSPAANEQVEQRLAELDREWDVDRLIELEAPLMILSGIALSRRNKGFLALSFVSASMVLLHAQFGLYPLLPLFRRFGIRTQREIESERNAMQPSGRENVPSGSRLAGRAWPLRIAPNARRVPDHTPAPVNDWIGQRTERDIGRFSGKSSEEMQARLKVLDQEWDTERTLKTNFSIVVLAALAADALLGKKGRFLALAASGFMIQHALQGWCPPLAVFRRLGVRTIPEIERERFAITGSKKAA